jgi:RNA polymerase sigma-70 factor (ECF subfamily)
MIPDREEASDIVQEVFIHLYEKLENGTSIEYPRSWLYKVTVNNCIDFIKKRRPHEKVESAVHLRTDENKLEGDEKQVVIKQALEKLKPDERALAVLYSEGLSYKEMAEATGIRFSSVGKTLSRTLQKLGDELKKLQYDLY